MKTKKFIKVLITGMACISLSISTYAQHWRLGGNTGFPPPDNVTIPGNNFMGIAIDGPLVNATPLDIGTGSISSIHVNAVLGTNPHFVGVGTGFTTPTQLLDVSGGNIDALTPNTGYMINDNYVLWHNGNINNIYVGVGAGLTSIGDRNCFMGFNAGNTETSGDNTFVGYNTGSSAVGNQNSLIGSFCGFSMTGGSYDTYCGAYCGYSNTTGNYNTMMGRECGYSNTTGSINSFYGKEAGFSNTTGSDNCFFGNHSAHNNISGNFNCTYGVQALNDNFNGNSNIAIGNSSLFNNFDGNSNVAVGGDAMHANVHGFDNVAIGINADHNGGAVASQPHAANVFVGAGSVVSFLYGDSNVFVGARTDINTPGFHITNAGAIGFGAVSVANNKFMLGNNLQDIGIGMSGLDFPTGPTNRLEISYYSAASPNPGGMPIASAFTPAGIGSGPTGTSGLQFRDLTDASNQYPYKANQGFLTVDDKGNVVYMQAPIGGTGNGAGYCAITGLTPLTTAPGAGYDLSNTDNFFFAGNGSGSLANNNVAIGKNCVTPLAKLDVLQASGATLGAGQTSIGINVENDDLPNGINALAIGLKSTLPLITCGSAHYPTIASWFEAANCSQEANNGYSYSIFVPSEPKPYSPGIVSIGYNLGFVNTNADLLQVNSGIYALTTNYPSDRRYKQDISSFSNALQKIDSINPVYFYYDTLAFPQINFSSKKQVGFIAQNVDSVLPEVVEINDSGYYNLDYSRMTVLLLAGEKELKAKTDTLNGLKGSVDSLKTTVDSLRTAFNSAMVCINNLCNQNEERVGQGNNNSDNNNNVQNVTLSTAAILYQNAPNPFGSGGTKINYFLPEGTMGASIVFFDAYGNKLKEVQLTQTGMGSININPNQLSNGVYTYSLVINGNVVDTKKMVFNK